ncbi:MAG: NAD(P)H-dependent oxidoreductase [bacterium]|nr:NAD(P)H-dependent oxidoreductase [bacterium]
MNRKKKLLLGVVASPRAKLASAEYSKLLDKISDYQKMYEMIYEYAGEKKISNTEGLVLASLFGAKSEDVDAEGINLKDVFQTGKISREQLAEKLNKCEGVIIGTPVYFGDRSSWFDSFVRFIKDNGINTKDKIFGAVSVGAKRNGGQETTLIFGLLDALNRGFNVVGNGPPTSQFGGTGWAGDIGKIQDDNFGLDTSMGLGKRVGRYFEIAASVQTPLNELKIGILHSGFASGSEEIKKLVSMIEEKGAKTDILNIDDLKIKPCLGCPICPKEQGMEYGCVIKDDMIKVKNLSVSVDGLIFMLYKGKKENDQYQLFLERTRFIRRDNFILSDIPFGAYYSEKDFGGGQYTTRMFTSFLRHNMYIVSPLVQSISIENEEILIGDPSLLCDNLLRIASKSKTARNISKKKYIYEDIGYGKKR